MNSKYCKKLNLQFFTEYMPLKRLAAIFVFPNQHTLGEQMSICFSNFTKIDNFQVSFNLHLVDKLCYFYWKSNPHYMLLTYV